MYGKLFASTYNGSMYGAGAEVFAVWGYALANADVGSTVELNPRMLASTLGISVEATEAAIDYLSSPDPKSRSEKHEGRRLLKEGQYQYFVVNHSHYRAMRNEDDRREYNRLAKQKSREKLKQIQRSNGESNGQYRSVRMSAHTDTDTQEEEKT